jgi:hypothetical protein
MLISCSYTSPNTVLTPVFSSSAQDVLAPLTYKTGPHVVHEVLLLGTLASFLFVG